MRCTAFTARSVRAGCAVAFSLGVALLAGCASQPPDIGLLPETQRGVAAGGPNDAPNVAALPAIEDPLARLVAAAVLFEAGRADPQVSAIAIDTASSQGWRRPLLAWLGVELKRAEQAGASEDAQRLRRIEIVQGPAAL